MCAVCTVHVQNQRIQAMSSAEWKRECRLIEWEKCADEPKTSKCKHNKDVQRFFLQRDTSTLYEGICSARVHAANLVNLIQRHAKPSQTVRRHLTSTLPHHTRNFRANFHFCFVILLHLLWLTSTFKSMKHYHVPLRACNGTSNWLWDKNRWNRR